jgi:hypothetical protein
MRLHTRTILRDGTQAFIGSQSLRQLELDARREIGIIFRDAKILKTLRRQYEEDWKASEAVKVADQEKRVLPVAKAAKKVAKVVSKHLEAEPVVRKLAKVIKTKANGKDHKKIEEALKEAVKHAVKEHVHEATVKTVRTLVNGAAGQD